MIEVYIKSIPSFDDYKLDKAFDNKEPIAKILELGNLHDNETTYIIQSPANLAGFYLKKEDFIL